MIFQKMQTCQDILVLALKIEARFYKKYRIFLDVGNIGILFYIHNRILLLLY